ncbi:MAG: hypothetical protein ABIS21_06575 [Acidimicrobiales bacterium]
MQFHWISRPRGQRPPEGYHPGDGPSWGSLPVPERRVLVEVLARYTTTPDSCLFCVWEGWGALDEYEHVEWRREGTFGAFRARLRRPRPRRFVSARAQVELPHRRYFLHGGPLEKALAPLGSD